MLTIAVTALTLIGLAQIYVLVRLRRTTRDLGRLQERASRLEPAISVLTDTCESGFRTVAEEIGRTLDAVNRPAPKPSPNRRVRAAARNGSSVAAIAAAEQMSEGEVRLRLQLPSKNGKPERKGRHALRAS